MLATASPLDTTPRNDFHNRCISSNLGFTTRHFESSEQGSSAYSSLVFFTDQRIMLLPPFSVPSFGPHFTVSARYVPRLLYPILASPPPSFYHVCIRLLVFFALFFSLFLRAGSWTMDGTNEQSGVNQAQPLTTCVVFLGRIWRLGFSGSRLLVSAMVDLAFGGWQGSKYPRLWLSWKIAAACTTHVRSSGKGRK